MSDENTIQDLEYNVKVLVSRGQMQDAKVVLQMLARLRKEEAVNV